MSDYSDDELDRIEALFIAEHNNYPLGVCIRKDIHDLFHSLYGKSNNTESQWNYFVANLKSGKYKDKITL